MPDERSLPAPQGLTTPFVGLASRELAGRGLSRARYACCHIDPLLPANPSEYCTWSVMTAPNVAQLAGIALAVVAFVAAITARIVREANERRSSDG